MKDYSKHLIGLFVIGLTYVMIAMPLLMGESIRLPSNGKMVGVMLLWIIVFPLFGFLIPGIIAIIEYSKSKIVWRYFYSTGWVLYVLLLILFSIALGNHSMN